MYVTDFFLSTLPSDVLAGDEDSAVAWEHPGWGALEFFPGL